MDSKKIDVWRGKYKGVPYEINNFKIGNTDQWTFYLILSELQVPDLFDAIWLKGKRLKLGDKLTRHIAYDYDNSPLSSLEWHCGCTYYEKTGGRDGETRAIKAGCDYGHYWDEGNYYSLSIIEADVVTCIESLFKLTEVLQHCGYCGEYVKQENLLENRCVHCKEQP